MKNIIKDFHKLEGAWAATGFSVVLIVVGLPIWWWTTTVYRAALPYAFINNLSSYHPHHTVNLSVIGDEYSQMTTVLQEKLKDKDKNIKFSIYGEKFTKKENKLLHSSEKLIDFEAKLERKFVAGSLSLFILPKSLPLASTSFIYISKKRIIYIREDVDVDHLSDVIHAMVLNPLANLHLTRHVSKSENQTYTNGMQVMRQVPTEPGYDVTLTLMLPQPHLIRAEWDVSQAVEDYLSPLVNQLKNISKLRIRSQILYMTSMKISPKWSTKYKHYSLPEQQLPITINAIEAKLGSFVSTRPALHFIIYVPSDLQTPLQIHTKDGTPLSANSFLVPRWGGIMVHNPPPDLMNKKEENQSLPLTFQIDSQWVMSTVVFHLHKLFPIPSLKNMSVEFTEDIYTNELTDWQLDGMARARVLSYLNNIRITLQSLCDLVGEISNMVVSDEVAGWVWSAVDDWRECLDASGDGSLKDAMKYCKEAFVYSDAAFFHPSMLALLYFPDNQKYAIYVPLFLPVSIPVVLSLRTIFKLFNFKDKKD